MNRNFFYTCLLLLFAASAYSQPGLPRESAVLVSRIHAAASDSARASALIRYGDFLIDYNKDSAVAVLKKALLLEKPTGRLFTMGKGHLLLGVALAEKGAYPEARVAYSQAAAYFTKAGNYLELAKAYNNLGNLYNMQGLIEDAVAYYLRTLRIVEQHRLNLSLGVVFNNIAAGLQKLGQHQKSLYYCTRGEAVARGAKDSLTLVQLLLSKSAGLLKGGKKEEGAASIREALHISYRIEYTIGKAISLVNLADLHYDDGLYDSSLHYQKAAKLHAVKAADPYYLNAVYYGLGKAFFALGNLDAAVTNLVEAKNLAESLSDKAHLVNILSTLSDVYAAKGQHALGLQALRMRNRYADTLQNEAVLRQVHQMETRYRTAEKDKELAQQQLTLLQQDAELRSKNTALLLAIGGLMAVCTIAVLLYRNNRQKQRLQAQRLVALQKEKETEALHALMAGEEKERMRMARELHDGVGSELAAARMHLEHLATAHEFLQTAAPYREALALVEGAAAETRKTAHNLMPEALHQHGLAEAVGAFCKKLNGRNNLEVEYQCYGQYRRLDGNFELAVYRMVQELLHNTLRHASASHVLVQLSFTGDALTLTVEDNGKGFDPDAIKPADGMGLSGLQTRVKALGGHMDLDTALGKGTAIYIELNLEHSWA